jgi:hypothetical protein
VKLFDVLTDEQWVRLQDLIDNPPEHAKALRERLRDYNEQAAQTWQPSATPWMTGEAIPESYRQERNAR